MMHSLHVLLIFRMTRECHKIACAQIKALFTDQVLLSYVHFQITEILIKTELVTSRTQRARLVTGNHMVI